LRRGDEIGVAFAQRPRERKGETTMKTLDKQGNLKDWLVEQGRALKAMPANESAASHRDYWERQHNSTPQVPPHNDTK
jgi:hypothetical protein